MLLGPLRLLLGPLRPRQGPALDHVQSVLLLLRCVPEAELETTPQAGLVDGSFASAVRSGGTGSRTGLSSRRSKKFCYICLEGDDGGKLLRGCACRGDSAGFVHLGCLTGLAMSKEASGDLLAVFTAWTECGNWKQSFQGALGLEMQRRFWRHHRSSQYHVLRYGATKHLAGGLGYNGELDAVNQLLDEASTCVGNNRDALPDLKILRAAMHGQHLEALGLLQAILPEAKVYTSNPWIFGRTMLQIVTVFLDLDRNLEAHEVATELIAFAKAKYGLEDPKTLTAMRKYAVACAKLGRVEEAKVVLEDVLTTQTRVLSQPSKHPRDQTHVLLRLQSALRMTRSIP